ncbi:MAG: transposase [Acidobacteria bacterium]|nr:transposase [Acidobacteriota bacterium]
MTKRLRRYPEEFRRQMIDLVRGGRTPEELSREFDPSAQAIRNWVAAAESEDGASGDWSEAERRELREAKAKIRRLEEEIEILKKAAVWFAREAGRTEGRLSVRGWRGTAPCDAGNRVGCGNSGVLMGIVARVANVGRRFGAPPRDCPGREAAGGRGSGGARRRCGRRTGAFPVGDRAGSHPEQRMWRRDRPGGAQGASLRGALR